ALDALNKARREIEDGMNEQAQVLISEAASDDQAICVYDKSWHQGIIGIVAGRMRERFHRPVIAFAEAGDAAPGELKGSARSVQGLHIRDALADVAARYPGLIEKFGGHAMAAGLSLRRIHLERFRSAFRDAVAARVTERDLAGIRLSDGELELGDLSLNSALLIRKYGPWGQMFEEPTFHGDFEVVAQRVVGEKHLKLVLKSGERIVDAIAFNQSKLRCSQVRILYRLDVNHYAGLDTLQLVIEDLEAA
ncbi:MAG: DHHA1 domain-containing protein, partial [Gammaproteobacteria bacterium]|nr:DHHA1 domain-containing protein [Gammaproteobacteria bacterium]